MPKRKIIGIAMIVTVLAVVALSAGVVFAQSATPWVLQNMLGGYGEMMSGANHSETMNGNGTMMGGQAGQGNDRIDQMHGWMTASGGMHDQVWKSVADALGTTTEELNRALSNGKTLNQIAQERGVSQDKLASTLETAIKAGLDKAVADGKMTQQQADTMLNHVGGNYRQMLDMLGQGMGPNSGGCHGSSVPNSNS